MKKKKATPKSSPKQSQRHGNSVNDQRQRVLKALRYFGYNIKLIKDRDNNTQGKEHTCGRYILSPGKWREGAS